MAIGDTIRTAREKLGWTRVQLSEKVGIDPSAISRIESGDRLPGPDVAVALESALELRKGMLSNAVIAEKKKKRDRIRQLKRLVYNSRLSVEEIRRRLGESGPERNK
jgi:ribosome-binding protein aMBF1 (putative translation factor)